MVRAASDSMGLWLEFMTRSTGGVLQPQQRSDMPAAAPTPPMPVPETEGLRMAVEVDSVHPVTVSLSLRSHALLSELSVDRLHSRDFKGTTLTGVRIERCEARCRHRPPAHRARSAGQASTMVWLSTRRPAFRLGLFPSKSRAGVRHRVQNASDERRRITRRPRSSGAGRGPKRWRANASTGTWPSVNHDATWQLIWWPTIHGAEVECCDRVSASPPHERSEPHRTMPLDRPPLSKCSTTLSSFMTTSRMKAISGAGYLRSRPCTAWQLLLMRAMLLP